MGASDGIGQAMLNVLETGFDLIVVASDNLSSRREPENPMQGLSADETANLFAVSTTGSALVAMDAKHLLPKDKKAVLAALSARDSSDADNGHGGRCSCNTSKKAKRNLLNVVDCSAFDDSGQLFDRAGRKVPQ